MIDVFESIAPDRTDHDAKPKLPSGSKSRMEAQQKRRYDSAQECDNGVVSLFVTSMPDSDLPQFDGCEHEPVLSVELL